MLKQLPLGLFLVNLCPDAGTPENIDRELRRRAEVLLRELETHPDWIVPWTYYYEDADPETTEITVRQLGREHLQSFKDLEEAVPEPNGEPCEPELQRRLEEAIG